MMKTKTANQPIVSLLLIFLLGVSSHSTSQTWERLFSKRSTDAFRHVIEAETGGFIATGYTADSLPNDTDAYVVRMSPLGDTLWTRTINGPLSRKDLLYKGCNIPGGFAFCGNSNSFDSINSFESAFFTALDDSGSVIWNKIWPLNGRARAQEIIFTRDSALVATGYVVGIDGFNGFIVKMTRHGDTLWSRTYRLPGSNYSDLNSIQELPDGGLIACGQCRINNEFDIYLLRTDSAGNELWSKNIGTANGGNENGESVQPSGTGFMLCGSTDSTSSNGTTDAIILRTDSAGNPDWLSVLGDPNVNDDLHQIAPVNDGGWVLCGTTRSFGPDRPNIWVVRTDSAGNQVWSRTFGGDNHDHGYSAIQTSAGNFIAAGYASSFNFNAEDAYIIHMDSIGELNDYLRYGTVTGIVSPADLSCADDSAQLVVTIANMGRDTISNFDVTVDYSGGVNGSITWNYPGAIFPGDVVFDTCPTAVNMMGNACQVDFLVTLHVVNDVYPPRNTYSVSRNIIQPPSVIGATRCGPGTLLLQASNSCESLLWFLVPQGGPIVNAGSSFNVNAQDDTVLYVQSGSYCPRVAVQGVVRPLPEVELGQGGDTFTVPLPYTLQAPAGYVSYVWSNLANTSAITVSANGLYCVTVIDVNGCAGSDCVYMIDSVSTGIYDGEKENIVLYPNPANDHIRIRSSQSGSFSSVTVMSYEGKKLLEQKIENSDDELIDLSGLQSGIYWLVVENGEVEKRFRFIKT